MIDWLSHYRVIRHLGAGGMGEVYLAEDTRLKRRVALKLLPPELAKDRECLAHLLREARIASALNHPNIVTIYEIGDDDDVGFMATEFIEGKTLREIGPLPPREALEVVLQVTSALVAAHAAGIIHRDLKPANIMRRTDGLVKVLDFGVAKRLDLEPPSEDMPKLSLLTQPGALIGTVEYMSPEQARGLKLDVRSDVFSLGVVLYEMVTGSRPFPGETVNDVLAAILLLEPTPAARLVDGLSPLLEAILARALAKTAGDRYQSITEMQTDLKRVWGDLELETRSTGPGKVTTAATRDDPRTSLAGREAETAALRAAFASAKAGHGLLVSVAGEAGIGKTALVDDFLARLRREEPVIVGRGYCSEQLAGSEAYLPILEALDSLLAGSGGEAIAAAMKAQALSWSMQVAPPASDDPSFPLLMAQLRASSAERLKREMVALLKQASQNTPLVLFLEDFQWSDQSTVDLLAYVGTRVQALHVLIVVTYRPSEMHRLTHPFLSVKLNLQSRGACRELRLGVLARDDVKQYVAREFPGHHFPGEFLTLIHEKTEGYPLFFVDLFHYLRDRESLVRASDGWRLRHSVEDVARDLPESVRSMIERTIAQLGEADRRLLSAASIQGRTFHAAVVARVLSDDEALVEDRLDAIARRYALVEATGEEELRDGTVTVTYQFTHGLYQNAFYATLTPARRAPLSQATANTLLQTSETTSGMGATLALLFETGRDFLRSAEYFAIAARADDQVFAYREAVALGRRGLKALGHVSQGPARDRLELQLQVGLVRPLKALSGYSSTEVMQTYERVRELSEGLNEQESAFFALSGFCTAQMNREELVPALTLAEQCSAIARNTQNPVLLSQAAWQRGQLLHYLGRLVEAREEFEAGLRVYQPGEHHDALTVFGLGDGPALSIGQLARLLWYLGYPDQARRMMVSALEVAKRLADPPTTALLLCVGGYLAACLRDDQLAEDCVRQLEEIHLEHALLNSIAAMVRAWTLSHRDRSPASVQLFQEAFEAYTRVSSINRTAFVQMHANVLANAGLHQEALDTIDVGLTVAEQTGERMVEAELWRLRGESLLRLHQTTMQPEIERSFFCALDVARRQSAKSWELRATVSRARLLQHQGRHHDACTELQRVLAWFTEGVETPDYVEAMAMVKASRLGAVRRHG